MDTAADGDPVPTAFTAETRTRYVFDGSPANGTPDEFKVALMWSTHVNQVTPSSDEYSMV